MFTGEIGQDLLSTLQEKNIKGLALWSNGFKQMTSNTKPLLHPADFQGQTFRIMPSEVIKNNSNFLALSLRLSRLIKYINPLNDRNLMDRKIRFLIFIQNVCTSCKIYDHQQPWILGLCCFNGSKILGQPPEDVKQLLSDAMVETTNWIWTQSKMMNDEQLQQIKINLACAFIT